MEEHDPVVTIVRGSFALIAILGFIGIALSPLLVAIVMYLFGHVPVIE